MSDKPVISPCVGICSLDENDICIGCYRSGREISDWGVMDNNQRRAVLSSVAEREQAAANFIAL
jgi:uncharacterized protein